jgi:Na+/proline symporter
MTAEPFLRPGIAWLLLTVFSVLWVSMGIWWGRRGSGDADDYLLAGRNVGLALSTATLIASWVTGNTTMTAPEAGYTLGLWGMIGYSLAGMGLVLFAPLAVRIKQLMPTSRTSGDFVRLRYGRMAWHLFLLITIAYTLVFLITQGMGAGLLLQALAGFDYRVGMMVVIAVATTYTLFGGLRAVIGTDFMQSMLIMVLLVVVAVLGFTRFGTLDIYTNLVAQHPSRLDLLLPAGLLFAWNTGLFSMGEVFHNNIWWSRVFASRSSVVFPSFVLGGIAWVTVPVVTGSIALMALAKDFPIPQVNMVFPIVTAKLLGAGGALVVFIIIFASLTSTLDSLLAASADLLAEDVYLHMWRPHATDEQLRRASKLIVIMLGLSTMLLSWRNMTSMLQLLLLTGPLVASTIWPIAMGLYWSSANRRAAIAAMLSGSISGLLAYWLIAPYCAALISAAVSAVVMAGWSSLAPERYEWRRLAGPVPSDATQ